MQALVKSFEAADVPARCAKFVPRKQWVVIGSDDMFIRVFNYNTMDRVKMWEAHADYIRSVAVHPNLPYILSCSDDMLIKLWDWEKGFQCTQVFEGHVHYVMQARFVLTLLCSHSFCDVCTVYFVFTVSLKSLADVACSTGVVDRGVWLRVAKQFLSCALVRVRGVGFRH